jgi:hypothetical protein
MLRKSFFAALVIAFAVAAIATAQDKEVKLTGYIIDNMCAAAHPNDLGETAKGHPTACSTMPNCMKSGYSLVVDGKQYKFDDDGNKKVMSLLKGSKTKKGLTVAVEGTVEGEKLHIKKIAEAES